MTDSDPPKIIVDEDWKSQIEREREQLRMEPESQTPPGHSQEASDAPAQPHDMKMPPPSFPLLVSMLATQALAALGQLADPETGQPVRQLEFAKYQIDLLAVLQAKTQGNLTAEEADMLDGALHELRMLYVQQTGST